MSDVIQVSSMPEMYIAQLEALQREINKKNVQIHDLQVQLDYESKLRERLEERFGKLPDAEEEPKKKSKKWLFVFIAVLCAAALGGWSYFGNNKSSDSENVIPQDSTNIAKVNTDSIEKAKKDSIEKACIDSIGKAKRDSIEKAVRDSLIRENDKKKALEAIKKTADKKKVDKKAGDNLPFDDMNEVQNSN